MRFAATRGLRRGHIPRLRAEKSAGSNRLNALEAFDANAVTTADLNAWLASARHLGGLRRSGRRERCVSAECRCGQAAGTGAWIGHDNLQMSELSRRVRADHDAHLTPTTELCQLSGVLEDHVQLGQLAHSALHARGSAGPHSCEQPIAPDRRLAGPSRQTRSTRSFNEAGDGS